MKKYKAAIMVPLAFPFGMVPQEFFLSFFRANEYLLTHLPEGWDVQVQLFSPSTFPIDANRNQCAGIILDEGFDTSIWLDADQELEETTLYRLLVCGEKYPIYAGIYYLKKQPHHPIVFNAIDKSFKTFNPILNYPLEELFYADMIGMGCVKIDREVFENTNAPYFKYQRVPQVLADKDKHMAFKRKHKVADVSEDVYFWKQVKNTDFRIVVDPLIQVGHITKQTITPNFAIQNAILNYKVSYRKDSDRFTKWWDKNFPKAELVNKKETGWLFDSVRQGDEAKEQPGNGSGAGDEGNRERAKTIKKAG